jgi:hypothetical protein
MIEVDGERVVPEDFFTYLQAVLLSKLSSEELVAHTQRQDFYQLMGHAGMALFLRRVAGELEHLESPRVGEMKAYLKIVRQDLVDWANETGKCSGGET